MQNNFVSKYFPIFGILVIVLGLIYLLMSPSGAKKEIVNPEGYPSGAKLSLYENLPPTFPKGVVLENRPLEYAGAVEMPDGKMQAKISYESEKSLKESFSLYKNSLIKGEWKLVTNMPNDRLATILATKGEEKVIVTIIAMESGAIVTIQAEK